MIPFFAQAALDSRLGLLLAAEPSSMLMVLVVALALFFVLSRSNWHFSNQTLIAVLACLGAVLLFLIIALPFYQSTREAARRQESANRLRAIGESLRQTHIQNQNPANEQASDDPPARLPILESKPPATQSEHDQVQDAPAEASPSAYARATSEVIEQYEGSSHPESEGHAKSGSYATGFAAGLGHGTVTAHAEVRSHTEIKSPALSQPSSPASVSLDASNLFVLLVVGFIVAVLVLLLSRPESRAGILRLFKVLGVVGIVLLFGYFTLNQTPNGSTPEAAQVDGSLKDSAAPIAAPPNITTERPDWVDKPASLDHIDGVYRLPVKSGPYVSQAECQQALQTVINRAVQKYIDTLFSDPGTGAKLVSDSAALRKQLIKQPVFAETLDSSVGPMQQLHALLEFDDNARAELRNIWRQVSISNRLRWAASGFAMALAVLGAVYVNLKFPPTSGGSRGRRLLWAAALAILLMTAGAMVLLV